MLSAASELVRALSAAHCSSVPQIRRATRLPIGLTFLQICFGSSAAALSAAAAVGNAGAWAAAASSLRRRSRRRGSAGAALGSAAAAESAVALDCAAALVTAPSASANAAVPTHFVQTQAFVISLPSLSRATCRWWRSECIGASELARVLLFLALSTGRRPL